MYAYSPTVVKRNDIYHTKATQTKMHKHCGIIDKMGVETNLNYHWVVTCTTGSHFAYMEEL